MFGMFIADRMLHTRRIIGSSVIWCFLWYKSLANFSLIIRFNTSSGSNICQTPLKLTDFVLW